MWRSAVTLLVVVMLAGCSARSGSSEATNAQTTPLEIQVMDVWEAYRRDQQSADAKYNGRLIKTIVPNLQIRQEDGRDVAFIAGVPATPQGVMFRFTAGKNTLPGEPTRGVIQGRVMGFDPQSQILVIEDCEYVHRGALPSGR